MVGKRTDGISFRSDMPVHKPLSVKALSEIPLEDVQWLWYPYIPAGKLTILEGDPGQGKSWITCALAADLSVGRMLPGQNRPLPPQRVLMLSAEDGLGDTVRPRVEAMGGDLSKVFVSDDSFYLDAQGIKDMSELMKAVSATIVFMDPIVAYLGNKVDMHRANEVRPVMKALADAAMESGSAIVAVRHLRKGGSDGKTGKAIYSGIGSIDFTAAVRSVVQVQETKGGTKFMYHAKHNLTPKGDSIAYRLIENRFEWTGVLTGDEDSDRKHTVATKSLRIQEAEEFLVGYLKDGPKPSTEVEQAAATAGVALQTLQRAKKGIAYSRKTKEGWLWYLDGQQEQKVEA